MVWPFPREQSLPCLLAWSIEIHSTGRTQRSLILKGGCGFPYSVTCKLPQGENASMALSDMFTHRFTPEERASRPQLSFMPFGFGPRICIGMRLALLETKVALIQVLKKYTFIRAPETEVHSLVCFNAYTAVIVMIYTMKKFTNQ